jgi:DUF4097 and DUF4098 domain-containing protein YvlB
MKPVRSVAVAVALLWSVPAAAGTTATRAVAGPVTVQIETSSADVEIRGEAARQVTVTVDDADVDQVALVLHGTDRIEPTFDGSHRLGSGRVRLQVPRGSRIELSTMSGDVRIDGLGGEVRCRSLSGDVHIEGASAAEVQTVSGDLSIKGTPGALRIKTVSGDVQVGLVPGPAAQLDFETTSGDLRWSGTCGARCRLAAATVSGDLSFALDPRSSFELRFQTYTGDLDDQLGITGLARGRRGLEKPARFGNGEGVVDCRTFSGDVRIGRH